MPRSAPSTHTSQPTTGAGAPAGASTSTNWVFPMLFPGFVGVSVEDTVQFVETMKGVDFQARFARIVTERAGVGAYDACAER